MPKILKFLKQNKELLIIILGLFIIPFFWFKNGAINVGGDSTRLYFYDPLAWIENVALYSFNPLVGAANFFLLPFLCLLGFFKLLGATPFLVLSLMNGACLVIPFISIYCIVKVLLRTEENQLVVKWSAIIAGLFFSLSSILSFDWSRALYNHTQLIAYPLIFLFALKFLQTKKTRFIIYAALITFLFSINFGFGTAPWCLAFFPLAFLFLAILFWQQKVLFFKFIVFFLLLSLCLNAFQLVPQIFEILNPEHPVHRMIFDSATRSNHGLAYFLSVAPYIKITYNFLALPQYYLWKGLNSVRAAWTYPYIEKFIYLNFVFPLIIFWGFFLLKKDRSKEVSSSNSLFRPSIILLSCFLIALFFISAKIGALGFNIYKSFFSLPGFAMFRGFYTKFQLIFMFFYALLLGMCLYNVMNRLKSFKRVLLSIFIIFLIIYNAIPLISGEIVNMPIYQSKGVSPALVFDPDFENIIKHIKEDPLESRYLTLPLTAESYQLFAGKDGGAYFGPSAIAILGAKNSLSGKNAMNFRNKNTFDKFLSLIEEKQYPELTKLLATLNVKYIYHNSDEYIYENFPNSPYGGVLKRAFPSQSSYEELLNALPLKKVKQISEYTIWENPFFLPYFYTPVKIDVSDRPIADYPDLVTSTEYPVNSAIFFKEQVGILDESLLKSYSNRPAMEFKKINPTKYIVRVENAKDKFLLVFSQKFNTYWKLYLRQSENNILPKTNSSSFISKNFYNTVQNDNLTNSAIQETWSQTPVDENTHMAVNSSMNVWLIDAPTLCSENACVQNPEEGYDLEFVVEYSPQRLFYFGLFISICGLLFCLGYLIFGDRKDNLYK